jgi:hypothetical protein
MDWQKEMEAAAQAAMQDEKPDEKFISFKSGVMTFNDQAAPGNKLQVVVVGSAFENAYFPGRYDPNKVKSPDCYAIALREEDLAPNVDDVTTAQAESCDDCPLNEWESDPAGGKGKACKNVRRLAVIQAFQVKDNAKALDVLYARIPVTSVANWSKYVTQIGNVVKRPPWGIVTEISVVPDAKSQFKVHFEFVELVEEPMLEPIYRIHKQLTEGGDMLFGYPKNAPEEEEAPAATAKSKTNKKY